MPSLPPTMLRELNFNVRRVRLVLLAITAVWCVYWFVHAWHYIEDDAWIHMEFARSVTNGQGFAFDGRVVAGDTAPVWVLLLVTVHAFLVNWVIAVKVLAALGAVAGFSGVYVFARRLAHQFPERLDAAIFPAAMVVLVAASPYTCYWLFSGMEALAGAGLACWAVLLATRSRPTRTSFLTGCLLAGIGPLVRPEMSFLTALLVIPLIAQWTRLGRPVRYSTLGLGALLFCGPIACWSAYSLHAFGHLLPNTNAAKRAPAHDSVVKHLISVYAMGFPVVLVAAAAGAVYVIARRERVRQSLGSAVTAILRPGSSSVGLPAAGWLMLAWTLVTSLFYVVDHTYVQTRYIMVTAPGLLVVIVACAAMFSRAAGRAVYIGTLIEALVISLFIAVPFVANKGLDCDATAALARFMHDRLPPSAPVATYSIGQVGFLSGHPIVDTGGITRPEVLPYLSGPEHSEIPWAQSEGAQYFIGAKPQPHAVLIHQEPKRFASWTIHPSRYKEPDRVELWKLQPLH